MAEFKMAKFKMATIINLSQNEWVKFSCANVGEGSVSEVFFCANGGNQSWQVWVCLRGKTKMDESKMVEFKMAAIIKLSQNEWVMFFLCKMAETKLGEIKMAAIIKFSVNEWVRFFVQKVGTILGKYEWVWEEKLRWLIPRWLNSRLQNSRWPQSSSWVRMNEVDSDWIS